jgi:hypothetical protein
MNLGSLPIDLIGTFVGALLTLFVFSYLLGDLPGIGGLFKGFYRLAMHMLIGAGVAYALAVAWWSILFPKVFVRLTQASSKSDLVTMGVALTATALGALLMFKLVPRWARIGNIATGYLVGVGLGVAIGGALIGTVYTQADATARFRGAGIFLADPVILLVGTLTALIAFSFTATARKGVLGIAMRVVQGVAGVGRIFVYIALGAAFAGVYAAGVAVLVGRLQFLIEAISKLFSGS